MMRAYHALNDSLDAAKAAYSSRGGESGGRAVPSILECVWGGNYSLLEEQRANLGRLWDEAGGSRYAADR